MRNEQTTLDARKLAAHLEDEITVLQLDESQDSLVIVSKAFAEIVINAENAEACLRGLTTLPEYPFIASQLLSMNESLDDQKFTWVMVRQFLFTLDQALNSTQINA